MKVCGNLSNYFKLNEIIVLPILRRCQLPRGLLYLNFLSTNLDL